MASNQDGLHNCIACNKPDRSENMVACDACKDRYHFSCATVDDSIRDNIWSCSKCASGVNDVDVSKSGRSSRSSRSMRIQLQLMRIEEDRKAEEKALVEKAELEKKFRDQKYAILMAEADENENSIGSHRSRVSSKNRVSQWLLEHADQLSNGGNGSNAGEPSQAVLPEVITEKTSQETPLTALGVGKQKGAVPKWTEPNKTNAHTSTPIQQPVQPVPNSLAVPMNPQTIPEPVLQSIPKPLTQTGPLPMQNPITQPITQPISQPGPQPMPKPIPKPVQQPISQPVQQSISQAVPHPVSQPMPWPPNPEPMPVLPTQQSNPIPPYVYPTLMSETQPFQYQPAWGQFQQQLAARQVVPKDLPIFTGNPEEWPLFVSSYRNSTAMCGYSDAENLMRLQRCLKGCALEAVRSNLLLPNSVP